MKAKTIIQGLNGDALMTLERISDVSLSVTINNEAIDYDDYLKKLCIDNLSPVVTCTINCLSNHDVNGCILKLGKLCSINLPVDQLIGMDLYDVESFLSKSKVGIFRTIEARPENLKECTKQLVRSIIGAKPDLTGLIIYYEWDDPHMLDINESIEIIEPILNDSNIELIAQVSYTRSGTEFIAISAWGF